MPIISSSGIQIKDSELNALQELKDASFADKFRSLGLNPQRDLKHSDLRRVDLSYSDLSGFDFSGSDLRGTIGVCVRLDGTTKFDNADLRGSCLARRVALDRAFSQNEKLRGLYARIKNDDWANRNVWIMKSAELNEQNRMIAQKLFLDDISIVDQNSLALAMHRFFDSDEDYYEYLLHVAATPEARLGATKAALRALGTRFLDRQTTIDLLKRYVWHSNRDLRAIAVQLIFKSRFWQNSLPDIVDSLDSEEYVGIRRLFVEMVGRRLGPLFEQLLRDPDLQGHGYLDFKESITQHKLLRMLTLLKRNSEAFARFRIQYENKWSARAEKDEIVRQRHLELMISNLRGLDRLGLRFKIIHEETIKESVLFNEARFGSPSLSLGMFTHET